MIQKTRIAPISIILLIFLISFTLNGATAGTPYHYTAIPSLTYQGTGYTVNYGQTIDITLGTDLRLYGDIKALLYVKGAESWQTIAEKAYNLIFDTHITQTATAKLYRWETLYTFPKQGAVRELAVLFHWFDNMNLTNWVGMTGASVQVNDTHWEHQVRWSKTVTFPEPSPENKPPPRNTGDPTPLIIGGLVGLAVFGAIMLYIKKKYVSLHI